MRCSGAGTLISVELCGPHVAISPATLRSSNDTAHALVSDVALAIGTEPPAPLGAAVGMRAGGGGFCAMDEEAEEEEDEDFDAFAGGDDDEGGSDDE